MFAKRRMILCGLVATSAVSISIHSSSALAEDCALKSITASNVNVTNTAQENFECLEKKLKTLQKLLAKEREISAANALKQIPRGAVIAFDRDDLNQETCPDGWSPFIRGRGRMIVGAGDPTEAPRKFGYGQNMKRLSSRDVRQHGGSEEIELFEEHLPKHSHTLFFGQNKISENAKLPRKTDRVAAVGSAPAGPSDPGNDYHYFVRPSMKNIDNEHGTSGSIGEGESFSIMPPFIALYFCKKL